MKAPAFDYIKPSSLEAVFALLAQYGDESRLLAGGQTLLATLNMRLSEPSLLIDIAAVQGLRNIEVRKPGHTQGLLRIGAMATHTDIEGSALVSEHAPLLKLAVPHIAHRAIRNLGTFGGSIAYGDPAAEWPTCLVALDGTVVVRSTRGERSITAKDFFTDLYTTALAPDELIIACDIPCHDSGKVFAFDELARRHGDYAICGTAITALRKGQATGPSYGQWRLVYLGIGTTPIRAFNTELLLEGKTLTTELIEQAAANLKNELEPLADLTNSAATKKHLAAVLTQRLLQGIQDQSRG